MSDALGYYRILEVYEDTNAEIIKKNYRDLAKKWHPDHNTAEDAIEKFQLLAKAYEVLSDEDSRLRYDLLSEVYSENNYPELENIRAYDEGNTGIRAPSIPLCSSMISSSLLNFSFISLQLPISHSLSKTSLCFHDYFVK